MKLKPFDSGLVEDTSMYDNLPYQRDPFLCNADTISLLSGNVLKFYRCKQGNAFELTDIDKLASEKIQEYQKREAKRLAEISQDEIEVIPTESDFKDELSENELKDLMADNSNQ